jgi:hypothetical protein
MLAYSFTLCHDIRCGAQAQAEEAAAAVAQLRSELKEREMEVHSKELLKEEIDAELAREAAQASILTYADVC